MWLRLQTRHSGGGVMEDSTAIALAAILADISEQLEAIADAIRDIVGDES